MNMRWVRRCNMCLCQWGGAMRKKAFLVAFLLVLPFPFASSAWAVAGRSTGWGWCAICGRDRPAGHDFTHGGGGGAGGYNAGSDPFVQAMTPVLGSLFNQIGQGFANSMFTDPAAEARQQALRQEQQRQQVEEARKREADQARLRQIAHERLMKSLKLTSTAGTGLRLKSLDDDEFGWDGRARSGGAGVGEGAVGSEVVDLRPAGTAFFGTGGGGEPAAFTDTSVVDLRDYQRARDLAQAANGAPSADRDLLLSEAERAAVGGNTVVLDPNAKSPPVDAAKYESFQTAHRNYREAEHGLSAAQSRLSFAERRVAIASQVVRQLEQDLDKLVASGTGAGVIAEKRKLLEEARKALAASEAERSAAQREVETAQSIRDLMKWGRRQELAVSGGGAWEPLPPEQEQNLSKLQRIYARQTVPPVPEIPGWVARAEAGRRALQQVDRYEELVASCPQENQAAAEIQLDRVRHKAEMMDYYDRVLNAEKLERIESMKQLQEIREEANRKMDSFAAESISTMESALGNFREEVAALVKDPTLQEAHTVLLLNEQRESAQDLRTEILAVQEAMKTGKTDPEMKSKVMERASLWSVDAIKALELLKQTDPKAAERILGRTSFWVKAGYGIARTTDYTLDLVQLNSDATLQSDALGDSAQYSKRLQQMYKRQVDSFHEESRRLDTMLAPTNPRPGQNQP